MNSILRTCSALTILLLCACNNNTDEVAKQSNPAVKTEKQNQNANISFSSGQPIDSTGYVIYPVYTSNGDEASSYKRDGIQTYRNLIFYNAATGAYHLLDKRKQGSFSPTCFSASFTDSVLSLLYEQWEKEK